MSIIFYELLGMNGRKAGASSRFFLSSNYKIFAFTSLNLRYILGKTCHKTLDFKWVRGRLTG
jgi:hypothetical protein